jgi:hypothetical protein
MPCIPFRIGQFELFIRFLHCAMLRIAPVEMTGREEQEL